MNIKQLSLLIVALFVLDNKNTSYGRATTTAQSKSEPNFRECVITVIHWFFHLRSFTFNSGQVTESLPTRTNDYGRTLKLYYGPSCSDRR
jgi:hypothetical protein